MDSHQTSGQTACLVLQKCRRQTPSAKSKTDNNADQENHAVLEVVAVAVAVAVIIDLLTDAGEDRKILDHHV
jgi:uncharacterized membrane protein